MELPDAVRHIVDQASFGAFCRGLPRLTASRPLLAALVERWWHTTDSFHFSVAGDMTMTSYDFSILTGIRVGGCSFIENVREVSEKGGQKTLHEQLISEILMEKDLKVRNIGSALSTIRNRVCHKKAHIVLDDVDESTELEKLVAELDWFGFGSRIIKTTKNQHTSIRYGTTHIYKVEKLGEDEAIELFKSNAFRKHQQMGGYEELVDCAVKYTKGVPLALKVLGSFLCGRNKDEL
ncbi:disease resistance protein RML1A-like [Camellia sinensis]|uniref:disease resistance protein RML1A-like n=1 Tax=Camellia sinensis TaxID=4442 RepID=UPI001035D6DE|nr:disease resistance protein RML1A-like [Camellia sinensis]